MNFEIPRTEPKITKEFLLSKNSEETYMSTYLGIPVKRGLLVSPLRNDHRPTASFYRSKKSGDLIFHDFGTGFHGNFIGVVMEINHCTYWRALQIIAEDFHFVDKVTERPQVKVRITETKIDEKPDTLIQIEDRPFTEKELQWWKDFGITERTLKRYKVHSCNSVFLNGNYFCSSSSRSFAFGYYGGIKNGMQLWRIYFPQKKQFRFLSNWDKHIIQGSKQLPDTGDILILEKSLKDVMCLYECGIPSCAPCSENIMISAEQMERLRVRFKNIFLFWDNDAPGQVASNKYKTIFPFITCLELKQEIAKDISDCYKKLGTVKFQNVILELKQICYNSKRTNLNYFNIL